MEIAESLTVQVDPQLTRRVLINLVTNAVQAMPNGGKLTIHVYKEANDYIITVKDTGVGIPEAIQSKMFAPMFTTKSKGQGATLQASEAWEIELFVVGQTPKAKLAFDNLTRIYDNAHQHRVVDFSASVNQQGSRARSHNPNNAEP